MPEAPQRPVEPRPPTTSRLSAWWWVAVVGAVGFLLIAFWYVRWGGLALAAGPAIAAILRIALPQELAGGLVIRTRAVDVAMYLILAAALAVATLLLRLA